jgi:TonB family protein
MLKLLLFFLLTISFIANATLWEAEKRVHPKYPTNKAKQGVEGCVVLQFFIDSSGKPIFIEPIANSGGEQFEAAAYFAVMEWAYKPTLKNMNRDPERQTVKLGFKLSEDSDIEDKCFANLSSEPHDIKLFRENRLSTPIIATDLASLKNSFKNISTVLSDDELRIFIKSYTQLKKQSEGKGYIDASLDAIDGLTYYQVIEIANLNEKDITPFKAQIKSQLGADEISNIPFTDLRTVFSTWGVSDMNMSLDNNLYDEISYKLLKIELLLNNNGTAQLLSTCRKVSDEVQAALTDVISDWKLENKKSKPKTSRLIWGVPANIKPGAYYDCDDNWFPEQQKLEDVPRMITN